MSKSVEIAPVDKVKLSGEANLLLHNPGKEAFPTNVIGSSLIAVVYVMIQFPTSKPVVSHHLHLQRPAQLMSAL